MLCVCESCLAEREDRLEATTFGCVGVIARIEIELHVGQFGQEFEQEVLDALTTAMEAFCVCTNAS